MACTSPLSIATQYGPITSRCKQCLDCRIVRQRSHALMNILESHTTLSSSFITLTYKPEERPAGLDYEHIKSFLKRLRISNRRQGNKLPIRFYCCGEFGEQTKLPHWHLLTYNTLPYEKATSLTRLWPQGLSHVGLVEPASVNYVTGYCTTFNPMDERPVSNWSTVPALGSDGIMQLATSMFRRGENISSIPTVISFSDASYPLTAALRKAFATKWHELTGQELATSAHQVLQASAHLQRIIMGDADTPRSVRKFKKMVFDLQRRNSKL